MSDWARTAVAPNFEIFGKIEIMRMISFFLPNLRLSAVGTPKWRIAAHGHGYRVSAIEGCCAGGMGDDPYPEIEDVHSPRTEDCEPMRMASLHCGQLHPNPFEKNQAWLEETQPQPETGYLT